MTTSTTLIPGTYKLRVAVMNPKPDRRARQDLLASWHQWVVWPAGTLFIAEPDPEHKERIRIYARSGYSMHAFNDALPWHAEAFAALAASMELITETPSDYVRRVASYSPGSIALELLDRCGISIEEIQRIMTQIEIDEEGIA